MSAVRLVDRPALLKHERTSGIRDAISATPGPRRETFVSGASASAGARAATYLAEAARALWSHVRAPDNLQLFAVRNPAGTLIGTAGIDTTRDNPVCGDLRGWILPEFGRQGIMTIVLAMLCRHGFDELGLLKLSATVFEQNRAVRRVLEKNAFALEGVLRKHFMIEGKLVDACLYGMLKEEFDARGRDGQW